MSEEIKEPVTEETEKAAEATEEAESTAKAGEEAAAEKGEKKENAFSKFWKKTKQSVNDSILESKIRSSFEKAHREFGVYVKNELISTNIYGEIEGNLLTVFGEVIVKSGTVIIAADSDKAYYAVKGEKATVKSTVEGVEYEREGTLITLDEEVTEVNVIKAGKRYFLYKDFTK